jgi:hypothetical protein
VRGDVRRARGRGQFDQHRGYLRRSGECRDRQPEISPRTTSPGRCRRWRGRRLSSPSRTRPTATVIPPSEMAGRNVIRGHARSAFSPWLATSTRVTHPDGVTQPGHCGPDACQ